LDRHKIHLKCNFVSIVVPGGAVEEGRGLGGGGQDWGKVFFRGAAKVERLRNDSSNLTENLRQ
jgi:hypothetical protein